jgi:hypothetical protein
MIGGMSGIHLHALLFSVDVGWPGATILSSSASSIAGMTGLLHHARLLLRWALLNFVPRLASNYDPPDLRLPTS